MQSSIAILQCIYCVAVITAMKCIIYSTSIWAYMYVNLQMIYKNEIYQCNKKVIAGSAFKSSSGLLFCDALKI